jgi:hypothetical protein
MSRTWVVIGYARWAWSASDDALEAARIKLLGQLRDREPRFRLLFPHPTPTVAERLHQPLQRMTSWLVRQDRTHDVPETINEAKTQFQSDVEELRGLTQLLPIDPHTVRLVVDTNALIDNPDIAAYTDVLGPNYMAHLMPIVLRENDDLKHSGRIPELRDAASRAGRRLKGLRVNGDVLTGVRVTGSVHPIVEHIEPEADGLPSWLDLSVPDDRLIASALLLQSEHPGSARRRRPAPRQASDSHFLHGLSTKPWHTARAVQASC